MSHAAAVFAVLLTLLCAVPATALQVRVVPAAPRQGDTVLVFVAGTKGA